MPPTKKKTGFFCCILSLKGRCNKAETQCNMLIFSCFSLQWRCHKRREKLVEKFVRFEIKCLNLSRERNCGRLNFIVKGIPLHIV